MKLSIPVSAGPLRSELAALTRIMNESLPGEPQTPHVYHYTSIDGLLGILDSRVLRATDVTYMNDTSEYSYACGIAEQVISKLKGELPGLAGFAQPPWAVHTSQGGKVYAACFCETGDLLSQWRAYSDRGVGYAIEFPLERLSAMIDRACGWAAIGRVYYDEDEQKEILTRVARTALEARVSDAEDEAPTTLNELMEDTPDKLLDRDRLLAFHRVINNFVISLSTTLPFLKSPAFYQEQEWRISVMAAGLSEKFRPSNGLLIPYSEIPLGEPPQQLPITRIMIGPNPHPRQAEDSLKRFLESKGLSYIQVDVSPIPVSLTNK